MNVVFEVIDKTGRKIRLTDTGWSHIRSEHPEIVEPFEIEKVITKPDKILSIARDLNF